MELKKSRRLEKQFQALGILPAEWDDGQLNELDEEDFLLAQSLAESVCKEKETEQKLLAGGIGLLLGITLFGG